MTDTPPQTTDRPEAVGLMMRPADFDLEPLVGMTIKGERADIWLSWAETQQLAAFLRRHVAA